MYYCIARNFRGVKLLQMDLQLTFRDLIFEDQRSHLLYYNAR